MGLLKIFSLTAALVLLIAAQNCSAETVTVTIKNNAFTPAEVRIAQGETVKWTNADGANHDVNFAGEKSPVLSKGESYSKTFDTPGTFSYSCDIHPHMKGRVVVR